MGMLDEATQNNKRRVPATGPKDADIAWVGEAPGNMEVAKGKPFVGPAGKIFESCLHGAGLTRGELYITNTIKEPVGKTKSKYFNERTGAFTEAGREWVDALIEELQGLSANIIVACGAMARAALLPPGMQTDYGQIEKAKILPYRGFVFPSEPLGGRKVMPVLHPANALYGSWEYRYYIMADMQKLQEERRTPSLIYPEIEIHIPETVADVQKWMDYFAQQDRVSVDIEVANHEVSCIGFSSDPSLAISVPLYYAGWSEQEELEVWLAMERVLGDPNITKVGQNFSFDMSFILQSVGVMVRGPIEDTMTKHTIVFPDFKADLGFMAATYTHYPYWKGMANVKDVKGEKE